MNSIFKAVIISFLFATTIRSSSIAQFKSSAYEVGVNAGTLIYQGDLSKSYIGNYKSLKPAVGFFVSKTLDPYFALRVNATFGKIGADESQYSTPLWKRYRSFKFSSPVTELSSTLVFNLLGQSNESGYRKISPYVFAGAGMTLVNIKRDWSKLNKTIYDSKSSVQLGLAIDTVHSLPRVIPVLPIGAGFRYYINSQLSINAEATYRFTTTDYLDGFKYAANNSRRDGYYGLSLGVSYRFGSYKCPPAGR